MDKTQKSDNKRFRDATVASVNYEKIPKHPERISNFKPFFDQYNWNDIEFPSRSKDWKKSEQNNKTIALNILFAP